MAIQKLLPQYLPSGILNTDFQDNYRMGPPGFPPSIFDRSLEGFSGGVSTSPFYGYDPSNSSIPYIRKSISAPDNSSYIRVNNVSSGYIVKRDFRGYVAYDVPSISVDSIRLRCLYSGQIALDSQGRARFLAMHYVYDENYYDGPILNYRHIFGGLADFDSTDTISQFVIGDTGTRRTSINGQSAVSTIDGLTYGLLNNLISSGSHIASYISLVAGSPVGPSGTIVSHDSALAAFSAFELEVSGQYPSKDISLYVNGPTPKNTGLTLYITGAYPTNYLDLYVQGANPANNNISLVIDGSPPSGNFDLYVSGIGTSSNNTQLYIDGTFPSGNLNLFTQANIVPTSGINLYTENHFASGNSLINLYTVSTTTITGNINLYMDGGGYGVNNDYINLFMYSKQPSGSLTLYTENHLASGNKSLNLYTISYLSDSGELPLHINGGGIDLRQNELTLFTRSAVQNSGDVNLSIIGNLATGPINLYIKAEDVAKSSGLTDFYIFSALNSGIYNSFDITTKAGGHEASLPIYMPVESTGSQTSNINMVLLNDTTNNKDVLLYIENHTQSKSGSYTLFTQGNGTLNGGNVYSSSMDMFINRSDESLSSVVPMTIMGPSGITNTVPFVIKGGTISESGITLNMPSTASVYVNQFDIMTHGF